MKSSKNKAENAITLIVFVITIIVMLIIAGITLTQTLSNNGLLSKTKKAAIIVDFTKYSEEFELYKTEKIISNENFYIIVNASKAAYPDTIKIRGEFEYTDYCKTQYTTWYPKGGIQVYRYVGLVARGIITYTVKYYWADSSTTTTTTPGDGYAIWKDNKGNSTKVYPGQQTPAEKGWSSDWHPDGSGQDPDKVVTTT